MFFEVFHGLIWEFSGLFYMASAFQVFSVAQILFNGLVFGFIFFSSFCQFFYKFLARNLVNNLAKDLARKVKK